MFPILEPYYPIPTLLPGQRLETRAVARPVDWRLRLSTFTRKLLSATQNVSRSLARDGDEPYRGRQRTFSTLHDWKMRAPQYSLTIHPARADQYLSLSPSPEQLRATLAACPAVATTALCVIPR